MTRNQKMRECKEFFWILSDLLSNSYEIIGSCNKDESKYLIPKGTLHDLTYYSKPALSFRISDHWNWYAALYKCEEEHYIQCYTKDMPWTRKREREGMPSRPVLGTSVCVLGGDGQYHVVYGEKFDRKTKTWSWLESDPADIAEMVAA